MSFEEEFDRIIRQKSEEADFPFDENNWLKASRMIDADRKLTRIQKLKSMVQPALIASAVAALSFLTYALVTNETHVSDNRIQPTTPILRQTGSRVTESPVIADAVSSNTNKTISQTKLNETPQLVKPTANLYSSNSQKLRSVSINKVNEEINEPAADADITHKSPLSSSQETNLMPQKQPDGTLPPVLQGELSSDIGDVQNSSESQVAAMTPAAIEQSSEFHGAQQETGLVQADILKHLEMRLPYSVDNSLMPSSALMLKSGDTDYFRHKKKTQYFYAEAGINYAKGWTNQNSIDGSGISYYGGVNYGLYLSNKISLGLGAQVYNLSHITTPYYSASHTEYDFGSTCIYTLVTCSDLLYAALPLKLNYSINNNNIFGFGFNAAYLVKTNTQTESFYFQDNAKILLSQSSGNTMYEGISQYNCMLSAHYRHQFGKRLALQLEGTYGLTDLFSSKSDLGTIERTTGVRFGILYMLYDN